VWSCVDIIAQCNEQTSEDLDKFMYAMKIENLVEPSEKEKNAGVTKK